MKRMILSALLVAVASCALAGEFPISDPPIGVAPQSINSIAVAANKGGYLVVWTAYGIDNAVFAARLDHSSTPIDPIPKRLARGTYSTGYVAVASDGSDSLVAFIDAGKIQCVLVRDDGSVVALPYSAVVGRYGTALTWTGSNYVLAFQDTKGNVRATIFAPDGSVLRTDQPIILGSTSFDIESLNLKAGKDGRLLLAWRARDYHLRLTSIDTAELSSGRFQPSYVVLQSPYGHAGNLLAVRATDTGYVVAWEESWYEDPFASPPKHVSRIVTQPFDLNGSPVGKYTQVARSTSNFGFFSGLAVFWTGSQSVVAFGTWEGATGDPAANNSIYAVTIDGDGTARPIQNIAPTIQGFGLAAPEGGHEAALAWIDGRNVVRAAIIDPWWGRTGGGDRGQAVSSRRPNQVDPAAAACGQTYFVAWEEQSEMRRVTAARFLTDGRRLDPDGIRLSHSARHQTKVGIACDGRDALVAWKEQVYPGSSGDLYATVLRADGTFGKSVLVCPGVANDPPAISWNGSEYLVVSSVGSSLLVLTRLRQDGTLIDPVPIVLRPRQGSDPYVYERPAIAWNGSHYLLVWQRTEYYYMPGVIIMMPPYPVGTIEAVRLTKNLVPDGPLIRLSYSDAPTLFWSELPRVASSPDGFGIVWSQIGRGPAQTQIQRISAGGTILDIPDGRTLGPVVERSSVSVGSSGREYRVFFDLLQFSVSTDGVAPSQPIATDSDRVAGVAFLGPTPMMITTRATSESVMRLYGSIPTQRRRTVH